MRSPGVQSVRVRTRVTEIMVSWCCCVCVSVLVYSCVCVRVCVPALSLSLSLSLPTLVFILSPCQLALVLAVLRHVLLSFSCAWLRGCLCVFVCCLCVCCLSWFNAVDDTDFPRDRHGLKRLTQETAINIVSSRG